MKTVLALPVIAAAASLGVLVDPPAAPPFPQPDLVTVDSGEILYRPLGSFTQAGKTRTPRRLPVAVPGFAIMKFQVTGAQYRACVADGACAPARPVADAMPQTGVSWSDASAFADWYSDRTGQTWRLPSDREWQLAAAERYGDGGADYEAADPGQQMLAAYSKGIALRREADPALHGAGAFGLNSRGLADVSGNVWEWTDGCMQSGRLSPDGTVAETEPYCGVRIAGGVHRAAVIDFVRDASVGGCAVGLPPDHLGFRLVRGE
ncbi:SUMF1/EgtB/PvdO family nonheme iron enzyme [Mameliella alba]|uniref:NirV n=1 Tax=Mameliella alba TaxID=561184 RepID=A0A0B3S0I3_9RHOB|nr:SUMF1/EgtB/PvdO family nonheme iron enzyme [Mameliella alba]KHQ50071.1 NirV [Mameliella alba]